MRVIQIDEHHGDPDYPGLDVDAARRVRMTVSCRDTDPISKVDNAGDVTSIDGRSVQVMHNGLLIDEGCYYGPWMTFVITGLQGHHEPQEEVVFDAVIRHIQQSPPVDRVPVIIELGSFWSYYSMWFCRAVPGSRAIAMEPDPEYLQVGIRNAQLNGLDDRITFFPGAVGPNPGETLEFRAESTGLPVATAQHDLSSVMRFADVSQVDLAMVDIQGAETVLLERARDLLRSGAIRFLVVSTHHRSISGDALTHQRALDLLVECGAHIIAEHSVQESYSGDGLIAATFDPTAQDMTVEVSIARSKDSLFGELEYDVDAVAGEASRHAESAEHSARRAASLEQELTATREGLDHDRAELEQMRATKLWRWSRLPREGYARLRRRLRR